MYSKKGVLLLWTASWIVNCPTANGAGKNEEQWLEKWLGSERDETVMAIAGTG